MHVALEAPSNTRRSVARGAAILSSPRPKAFSRRACTSSPLASTRHTHFRAYLLRLPSPGQGSADCQLHRKPNRKPASCLLLLSRRAQHAISSLLSSHCACSALSSCRRGRAGCLIWRNARIMAAVAPRPVLRTASTEHLHIRSPVPDATSLPEGAVCRTVERLERSADELSSGGSDIGEEIRKLHEEQRRSESRRSSVASRSSPTRANQPHPHPTPHPLHTLPSNTRSRGTSTSSYSNSIVDLNREARWGGYSPAGFIGSPAASIHSELERPGSSDTFRQANLLFQDFDGVHFSPANEEFIATDEHGNIVGRIPLEEASEALIQQEMLIPPDPHRLTIAQPPPLDNMVYYPAPVPRILNLPKRLSSGRPQSGFIGQRKSQSMLFAPRSDTRNTLRLGAMDFEPQQEISSMASMNRISNVPPQLRASLFFDRPAERQSINIQSDSAVATLESILQASATAPVSVFTDHPIVGRAGADVYAKERPTKRNTMSKPLVADARNSVATFGNAAGDSARRRSASVLLEGHTETVDDNGLPRRQEVTEAEHTHLNKQLDNETYYDEYPEEAVEGDDEELEDPDMGSVYAQPTTLLAELQMRKAQQKSRNRTAATAFPNGMHATLLELDAVAQVESRKRKNHKVALAWEDPAVQATQDDDADADVPLAVLYPNKNGLAHRKPGESEWDRPLGLMERRQLEDNEPLSRRRNRLLGINPRSASRLNLSAEPSPTGSISPRPFGSSSHLGEGQNDSDEDIPLAERKRRLQQKAALDEALGDVSRDSKSTFEADVLSVFGVSGAEKPTEEAGKENAQETLGQRRERMQREKSGLTIPTTTSQTEGPRPALRQSTSLANLLGSNPLDPNSERLNRRNITSPAPGSLLGRHETVAAQQKAQLRQHNSRKSSYQDGPHTASMPYGFMNGAAQHPLMGYGSGMVGMNPNINMGMGMGYGYGATGMRPGAAGGQGMMQMQDDGLNPVQRDTIDRWRSGVA
ncbi:hypothetical protein ANO11243_058780 [Dothideomycetidae sp. 11243]|nr:hypothetical protein ANO11243_058780 [fungal sp. No.11243]